MEQAAGYLVGFRDVRAIMDKLEIPDKGVDDAMLTYPINDWLAKTKRHKVICVTVGDPIIGLSEEGILLVTHIRVVRKSQNAGLLVEGDRDRYVRKWLVEEGGATEESLRWMSFPDSAEVNLFAGDRRPRRNNFSGPCVFYNLTPDQALRQVKSHKTQREWAAEAIANGEVLDRVWPPM